MASYLPSTLSSLSLSLTTISPPTNTATSFTPIRCGPRSSSGARGPLLKGRTLSSEAILAVQSLKRHPPSNDPSLLLSRLIKSDLLSAFNELLRQDRPLLALRVFSALQSEHHSPPDLTPYADLVTALGRHRMWRDIDRLIALLEEEAEEGIVRWEGRGLVRLVKAVIGAGRGDSTVRIYEMIKRGGWGRDDPTDEDEYLGRVFARGFRRFGEEKLAEEVDDMFGFFVKRGS